MADKTVEAIKHKDTRKNIPTSELRDFVEEDGIPKVALYEKRDKSLDPQLVWKGKFDEYDENLEVVTVPIYIQEKIHPRVVIEDLRQKTKENAEIEDLDLFGDFNGIKFEQMIDFYKHEQNWSNRMILGDSLLVMNSLAEKEKLRGKVQMIYIDPPYGIKFGSNWQVSTRKRDVKDGKKEDITRQPEQIRAFRDTWELGIHSYLEYLRDRLIVARELLTESGSVFVQIGDENVHLVRCLMDEVFGSENFAKIVPFQKTSGQESKILASTLDYAIWYSKSIESLKYRQLFLPRELGDKSLSRYDLLSFENYLRRRITKRELQTGVIPNGSKRYQLSALYSEGGDKRDQAFYFNGEKYEPRTGTHWKTTIQGLNRLNKNDRIEKMGTVLRYRRFVEDFPVIPLTDRWDSVQLGTQRNYVVETSYKVIERCLLMTTDPGDIVLDPTCGSGTSAYVAEQWGRRWITIDTSRVAIALARTRLMGAKYPYYILADSVEGTKKEVEVSGQLPPQQTINFQNDIRKGFVYRRVPHITLKSIAHNEEIDTIYEKWQEKMEPLRSELNELLGKKWEEWEIPRESSDNWLSRAKELHQEWWKYRIERQKSIDESIAGNADSEILYDKPYEDKKRIRVTGPFTVESISPHKVISTDVELPESQKEAQSDSDSQFEITIIENLKKAGVQNTRKNERLKFDRLEPFAGKYINAEGEFTDQDGNEKRVAVYIGPQYGTVSPTMVKESVKEAKRGIGFDLLIVCGFAFDPGASHEAEDLGKWIPILLSRMNPDLLMGDELLKKTGAGNLFMVFGEPDIEIKEVDDNKIVVKIKGLDIYDPTTGQIRSSSTDDIACWFIDTNYNEESFFVRQAYFTGGNDPYKKLKRALKAEIDREAWASLNSTQSRPFPKPKTGKIAIKVINHYGDEVLKVYELETNGVRS